MSANGSLRTKNFYKKMNNLSKKFPLDATGVGANETGYDSLKTTPPAHYTEGTLLADMKNAAKFIQDPKLKEFMKDADGIGTPATRASMIDSLKKEAYLKVTGKKIISTEKGRSLVSQCMDGMTDPGRTAVWESKLQEIAAGKLHYMEFVNAQKAETLKVINYVKSNKIEIAGAKKKGPLEKHPCAVLGCMEGGEISLMEGKFGFFWSCGRRKEGCSHKIKGNDKQDPYIEEARPIEEKQGHGLTCEKCKKGTMRTRVVAKPGANQGKTFLACDAKHCNNAVFDGFESTKPPSSTGPSKAKAFAQESIEPLPGEGSACTGCGNGILQTKKVFKKESPAFGKRFLACSERCNAKAIWEDQIPAQGVIGAETLVPDLSNPWRLPGEGKPCPKCSAPLVTQKVPATNLKMKGKRYLNCSSPTCQNTIWEEKAMKMF